jgi:O-glycosyl hydrolase
VNPSLPSRLPGVNTGKQNSPARLLEGGSIHFTRKIIIALVGSLLALTGSAGAATVTIDGSQTYQTIDGFGVNANSASWTDNELEPVLDALIDQAGMTLFVVLLSGNCNYEAANDNGNPNSMNWSHYNSVYSTTDFQKLWGIMAYLNQKGITSGLMPKFGGPAPLWMGGLSLTPGYENEYAEAVASALIYARNTQHLQFSVVDPVNEPDTTYSGTHLTGVSQYVTVMHDLGLQLDANGMSDVGFLGLELAYTDTNWMAVVMGDSYLMSKLACFGLHSYAGLSRDSTGVYDFIQQSGYPDRHFWMTEFGVWCSSCMSGTGGDGSWAYARGTASTLINHLANGASAGIVWEGYDNLSPGYNASTGQTTTGYWTYWGLFAVDNINAVPKTYTPRKQFYTLSQITRFVRPGAQRIDVSGSTTPLTLLAFYQSDTEQLTLTGLNTNSSAVALAGSLTSLPGIGSLELYYTDRTNNLRDGGAVRVTNSTFAVTVPADCVFTLVGSSYVAGAPVITRQPQSRAVVAADAAHFTVTASGAEPLSYQWYFNGATLADGGHLSGSTSPTFSIVNAQATNAGSYSVVVTNAVASVTSAVAVLAVIAPGSCSSPPAGLVGWWPGDGNANDIAGTNAAVLAGGAAVGAPGMVGSAFNFDGTNAFVQVPDAPALKPAHLTLEAWVLFSDLDSELSGNAPDGDQYIVFKQNSQMYYFEGYALEKFRLVSRGGDVFMFTVGSPSGQEVFLPSATLISTGVWYHVAAVRGSNFMQLYVNGQLEGQTNVSFAQDYGGNPLYFGTCGQTFWDGKLKGRLDEVSLYNRALSALEVSANYAVGAAGKCRGLSITAQPQSQSVVTGSSAVFSVTAAGTPPLSYQWQFNGVAVAGATTTNLTLANIQSTNTGSYSVVVTNSSGSVTSGVAVLTVLGPSVAPRLLTPFTQNGNLSFALLGETGRVYRIEVSSDVQNWSAVTDFTLVTSPAPISQPITARAEFYRARVLP